uniref:peptidylprolyl isomerase n=1 Tax=Prasinoderma coloniale TaxID=156133 RepID=A0A7R9Y405_9VIRI|eukprot:PRCOL_00005621-RA
MAEVGAGVEGALEGAADGSAAASAADAAMDDFFADERVLLEYNRARRMQALNGAPADFPTFLRDGFEATVVTPPETDYVVGSDGLLTLDFELGTGRAPGPTDEVVFEYKVYNEAGKLIDGTYNKETPGQTRLGLGGLIPGVEEGMLGMRVGGRRRIVCPPELGPPVGPQTFFMSRQYEVFDVKLLEVHTCTEKQVLFTKRSVCE